MFERFPFTNLHQLNLDWIIEQLKNLEAHAVLSVNGQTGDVVLYQDPDIQFPEVDSGTWRMVRTAGGNTVGIMFQNGLAYIMNGNTASRVYTIDNPPAYPVTSVNGQTGAVETYNQAYNRLPAVSEQNTNFYRTVDKDGTPTDVGVQVDKNKLERMSGQNRYQVYDTGNTPSLVTSVNGQSGAVIIAVPFDSPLTDSIWMGTQASEDHTAGFGRETVDGTVQLYTVTDGTHAEAFLHFVSSDDQYSYTKKLLTTDDIPSSSGVVSINSLTGVVTLYGTNITRSVNDNTSIDTALTDIVNALAPALVNMTPSVSIPNGNFCQINGVFYKNTSGNTLPANTPCSLSDLTAVDSLGLMNEEFTHEALKDQLITRTSSANQSFNIPENSCNLLLFEGNGGSRIWAGIVFRSTGAITIDEIFKGTGITDVTQSNGVLTITAPTAQPCVLRTVHVVGDPIT